MKVRELEKKRLEEQHRLEEQRKAESEEKDRRLKAEEERRKQSEERKKLQSPARTPVLNRKLPHQVYPRYLYQVTLDTYTRLPCTSRKINCAQNEVVLGYHRVRGLYFLAFIFAATIDTDAIHSFSLSFITCFSCIL